MKQPRAAGFLIVVGSPVQKFLLMKHRARWDLPKGHVDPGETDMECALRELHEETAIAAADLEVDPDFRYECRYKVGGKRYGSTDKVEKTLTIFLGRLINDVEIVVTEHLGYDWFKWNPPHEIQTQAIDPLLRHTETFMADRK